MIETFKKDFRSNPFTPKWKKNQVNKNHVLISQPFSSPSKAILVLIADKRTAPTDVRAVSQQRLMRVVHHRGFLKS